MIFLKKFSYFHSIREMDNQMETLACKYIPTANSFQKPVHLNICLSRDTSIPELVQVRNINENSK